MFFYLSFLPFANLVRLVALAFSSSSTKDRPKKVLDSFNLLGDVLTLQIIWAIRSNRVSLWVLKSRIKMDIVEKVQGVEGPNDYVLIKQNEFSYRKHKKQIEEDIAVCDCKYVNNDPDSACGDRCLNALTSTECTPGYCRSGTYCKNQKFQRCEYAKTKPFNTDGRGWGVMADESIKAGRFIIEYCGEIISWKEAKKRAQEYENQGVKDAYIISLNGDESIDATRKGSLARFINHSCEPNCETRKWTVLGEIRVGIFAKHDIPIGAELAYNYNFEWYGGAKVRCLCGAAKCCGFLGARSRRFQEDTYLWEDDDGRYTVENIPLYDSDEDELSSHPRGGINSYNVAVRNGVNDHFETALIAKPLNSDQVTDLARVATNSAIQVKKLSPQEEPRPKKKMKGMRKRRPKLMKNVKVDAKSVLQLLVDPRAREEIVTYEQIKTEASTDLQSLYDEIRPSIEERERDNQDSLPTSLAEKYIGARCSKLKAEFDLHYAIIKNMACTPIKKSSDAKQPIEETQEGMKLLTN